ncbi:MAG: insulinase family protein [Parcubacteria group bacterium]|nr:insulinase family protein [Parcubacteria group bacterium]
MLKRKIYVLFVAVLALILSSSSSFGASDGRIRETRLSNGLTVVLKEQHRVKTVVFYLMVRAGVCCEGNKTGSGLSHFTEHLLADYVRWSHKTGASANAFTGSDRVGYYIKTSSEYLDEALDAFAGNIRKREFSDEYFQNERNAVLNEAALGESEPERKLWNRLMREAFQVHPYGRSIVGETHLADKVTKDEVVAYLKERYVPAHMLLVVVGDFSSAALLPKLEQKFGTIPEGPYAPVITPVEPPQVRERVVEEETNDAQAYFGIAYRGVSFNHPDAPALDLLASILGDGKSSRFYQRFIVNGAEVEVGAYSWTAVDDGLFEIVGSGNPDALDKSIVGIEDEISKVRLNGVSQTELDRVKLQYRMDFLRQKENILSDAFFIGDYRTSFGTISGIEDYLLRYERVTIEDIRKVALNYLLADRKIKVLFRPKKDKNASTEQAGDSSRAVSQFKRQELPNGARLLWRQDEGAQYLLMSVFIDLGAGRHVLPPALRVITARMFERSKDGLFNLVEGWGGSFSSKSSSDYFSFTIMVPSEREEEARKLMEEVLSSPLFTEAALNSEKTRLIREIAADQDDPFTRAMDMARQKILPNHPYNGRISVQDVESISTDYVRGAANEYLCPRRTAVVIGGKFSVDEVRSWAGRLLKDKPCPVETSQLSVADAPSVPMQLSFEMAKPSSNIIIALRGPEPYAPNADRDRAAMYVIAKLLHLRINQESRGKAGISYSQGAFLRAYKAASYLTVYIATNDERNIALAEKILKEELDKVANAQISDEELSAAVKAMTTGFDLDTETISDGVSSAGNAEMMHGQGQKAREILFSALRSVTPADLLRVARAYLSKERAVTVIQKGISK